MPKIHLVLMSVALVAAIGACTEDPQRSIHSDSMGLDHDAGELDAAVSPDVGRTQADALPLDMADEPPVFLDAAVEETGLPVGLSRRTIEHDGLTREYLVYVPSTYTGDGSGPLLLNFHGFGDDASRHLEMADMRPLAEAENIILVYPQGSPLDTGESHWNPLLDSMNNKSDADDFGFIAAMLAELAVNVSYDERRVYATGYSNGAGFVYGLVCYSEGRIAAAAPVSGSMYVEMQGDCEPRHPVSIAIFNGTEDSVRPYDGYPEILLPVDDAVSYWRMRGNIMEPPVMSRFDMGRLTVERSLHSGGESGAAVALYKVIGGGHVWFDLDIEGADLNGLIWSFVSQYDIDGLRQ